MFGIIKGIWIELSDKVKAVITSLFVISLVQITCSYILPFVFVYECSNTISLVANLIILGLIYFISNFRGK